MSKRTGEMVTFEELLDEVGADAARYFFLRRSTDQPLDFDIELAKEQSADNPVFYVQYAHARICSILRKAAGDSAAENPASAAALAAEFVPGDADLSPLTGDAPSSRSCASSRSSPRSSRAAARPGAAQAHALRRGPRGDVPPVLHAVPRHDRRRRAHGGSPVCGRRYAKRARDGARAARRECAGADVGSSVRRRSMRGAADVSETRSTTWESRPHRDRRRRRTSRPHTTSWPCCR